MLLPYYGGRFVEMVGRQEGVSMDALNQVPGVCVKLLSGCSVRALDGEEISWHSLMNVVQDRAFGHT